MTKAAIAALTLLLVFTCGGASTFAQVTPAAGQTPQAGTPGAAAPAVGSTPATQNGKPAGVVGKASSANSRSSRRMSRTSQRTAAQPDSTAPLGNSRIVIYGSNAKIAKPTDDHPLLDIASVGNPLGIRSGTPIQVQLQTTADSGHVRNGDTLPATLVASIGGLAKGTAVQLTVVQASQAGTLTSGGELSLQVTRIGNYDVLSVIVTALGKEGAKALPDAAPAVGTEAEFAAGKDFSFPAA